MAFGEGLWDRWDRRVVIIAGQGNKPDSQLSKRWSADVRAR